MNNIGSVMPESPDADHPNNLENESGSLPQQQASSSLVGGEPSREFPIAPEVLDKLPPEDRERVLEFFSAGMQWAGPMPNPLLAKIEPQHITDMIGLASRTAELTHSDRKHGRLFSTIGLGLVLAAALTLLLVLAIRDQNALIVEVVKLAAVGLGGIGGGYGIASWRNRN